VSGLLLASAALGGPMCVLVEEPVESRSYIGMTIDMLASFGAEVEVARRTRDGRPYWSLTPHCEEGLVCPGTLTIEGDWSCGAFWLCAGAIGGDGITLRGLDTASSQGDRAMALALESMGAQVFSRADGVSCRASQLGPCSFDASDTPHLLPPPAAGAEPCGATIGLIQLVQLLQANSRNPLYHKLGDALPLGDHDIFCRIEVYGADFELTAIVRIDKPGGICHGETPLEGQTAPRLHKASISVRNSNRQPRRDESTLKGPEYDVLARTQVKSGITRIGIARKLD